MLLHPATNLLTLFSDNVDSTKVPSFLQCGSASVTGGDSAEHCWSKFPFHGSVLLPLFCSGASPRRYCTKPPCLWAPLGCDICLVYPWSDTSLAAPLLGPLLYLIRRRLWVIARIAEGASVATLYQHDLRHRLACLRFYLSNVYQADHLHHRNKDWREGLIPHLSVMVLALKSVLRAVYTAHTRCTTAPDTRFHLPTEPHKIGTVIIPLQGWGS